MKETQKIYDVLKLLEEMYQNSHTKRAKQILRAFLIANDTVKKSDKVNIWKFVGKDIFYLEMTGVCYIPSMKLAVASDKINTLISKPDYVERETNSRVLINDASEPCGIYRKDGTGVTMEGYLSEYPPFLMIIPREETQKPATMNDRDAVVLAIKEAKIAIRMKTARRAIIQVAEGIWMRLESAELMLTMPEWKFACDKDMPGRREVTYRDDNYTALFMPAIPPDKETNEILYLV